MACRGSTLYEEGLELVRGPAEPMLRFVIARLGVLIPTFLGVTVVAFGLIRLIPGDPIQLLAGERGIDPARHARLMAEYGFDRPLWEQYLRYLGGVLQGDLGQSIVTKRPVLNEFMALFPATVELSVCALLLAVLIGLPAGVVAGVRRGSLFDHGLMGISLTGFSMPIFWWGLLLIILFSGILQWTPVSGRISLLFFFPPVTGFMLIDSLLADQEGAFTSALSHLVLPSIVLATVPLAIIARQTRSAMLEVLGEDYVRTARAKGLPPSRVIGLHALRNALIPVVTVIGLQVGLLFSGAILTETIFSWPGIGKWLVDSIYRRDYPSVQGGIVLIASVVMLVNLFVDLLYGLINPRIRHAR
jgi:dipeptide transport system permease protein